MSLSINFTHDEISLHRIIVSPFGAEWEVKFHFQLIFTGMLLYGSVVASTGERFIIGTIFVLL